MKTQQVPKTILITVLLCVLIIIPFFTPALSAENPQTNESDDARQQNQQQEQIFDEDSPIEYPKEVFYQQIIQERSQQMVKPDSTVLPSSEDTPDIVPGEILCKFKPGVDCSTPQKASAVVQDLLQNDDAHISVSSVEPVLPASMLMTNVAEKTRVGLD
ncbi:MAG: hypothetical protein V1726_05705 [Methanobacteriota archaeon]